MCSHFYLLQSQQVNKWCTDFDLFVEVMELKSVAKLYIKDPFHITMDIIDTVFQHSIQ